MNKPVGFAIIFMALTYISAVCYKDYLGIWTHFTILHQAHKINPYSKMYLKEKLALNQRAIQSAPSPWAIVQRIKLLNNTEVSTEFERSRLLIIFNTTYEKEIQNER